MPGSHRLWNLGLESRKVTWVVPTSGGSSFLRDGATEKGFVTLEFVIILRRRQVRALPTTLSLAGLGQLRWRKEEEGCHCRLLGTEWTEEEKGRENALGKL